MTSWLTNLAVMLCVCFFSHASGSAIVFQSSSSSFTPLISSNLTVTCSLHDTSSAVVGRSVTSLPDSEALADDDLTGEKEKTQTDQQNSGDPDDLDDLDDQTISKKSLTQTTEDMPYVTSIMISRDGVDLATITEHFPARPVGGASGFQVSGQMSGTSGERAHLQIMFPHPTQVESGNYVCDIDTLNSQGRSFDFSQTLEVSDDDVTINNLVSHIHQSQLEKENANIKMNKIIDEMNAINRNQSNIIEIIKTQIGDQSNTIGIMNQTIGIMKTENSALKQSLDALKNIARVEPNVFFSAILTPTKSFSSGQTMIFNKVVSNEGAAYSSSTGTFTSPVDGFYHFEIHSYTAGGQRAYLSLRHNGNTVIAVLNEVDKETSSNSVTLKVAKDDTVNVVATSSSTVYGDTRNLLTTFSGNLISLV